MHSRSGRGRGWEAQEHLGDGKFGSKNKHLWINVGPHGGNSQEDDFKKQIYESSACTFVTRMISDGIKNSRSENIFDPVVLQ